MSQQTATLLMLLATFLMIAAPAAFPLAAYWRCRRLKADATPDVTIAFAVGVAVAIVCAEFARRCAYELA